MYEKEKEIIDTEIANKLGYMEPQSKQEKLYHTEAFEYYYSLGAERTLEKVAKYLKKNNRTISNWNRQFNWQERVKMRDIEVSKKLAEKTTNAIVDEKANYRKVIKLAMGRLIKELQDEDFKSKGIQDLERLIKLDMLLMGENTEKVELDNKQSISEADRQALKQLSDNIAGFIKI